MLRDAFRPVEVESARWFLTPFLAYEVRRSELPMVRLSQRFEFSASHRLHNPRFSDEENRRKFGKCNNPHGHGHNYEVQVTLAGEPDQSVGVLIDVPAMERIVSSTVIDRFDHKNLNVETEEFRDLIPSVENIAMVIFRMLKPQFERQRARLASVTVWETPKTWCEYSE
jgi:6-pyruvoyltetrahydropterin/6-carboxytetrahydropterin synthase